MYILGISALYHDAAAALLRDGELVAAAQEERFSRIKYDHRFPDQAVQYCLEEAGIGPKDLDYVVFYEQPFPKFERILLTQLATYPQSWELFREAMISWFGKKLWVKSMLMERFPLPADRFLFAEHHISHAASAFFCSPFKEAAIMTLDGVGEWTTTAIGRGANNQISLTEEIRFPHSLGLLYSAFTGWLGFKVNSGEYKVMGMAPYGKPNHIDKVRKLIRIYSDGSFCLDMDYFSFHYSLTHTINSKFICLFGPARKPESPFFTRATGFPADASPKEADQNQYYADVAASLQYVTEEVLIKIAQQAHQKTGLKNLVMAGGVALNSVANGRVMTQTPFENVYIQPNAGDAGGALGAALYGWHVLLGKPRRFVMEHAYYGKSYSEDQILKAARNAGVRYEQISDTQQMASRAVDSLAQGKVLGLFQGRFEWGPRALGNRSILADPRRAEMKEVVNTKIKFREPFRPFAPVLTEEDAPRYFDLGKAAGQYPLRFMLSVHPVLAQRAQEIPAVCHEGTGRVQVVKKEWNSLYHEIIRQFGQATGTPVLMNTSFNLRSEPMVASPADALNTFSESGLDHLVLGNLWIKKTSGRN